MSAVYETLVPREQAALDQMRQWARSQGVAQGCAHLDSCVGKLEAIAALLASGRVAAQDRWKLAALGVLFGDALEQTFEGRLRWVVIDDELGKTYALCFRRSDAMIYPLSAIRSRVEEGLALDVKLLFSEYVKALPFQTR